MNLQAVFTDSSPSELLGSLLRSHDVTVYRCAKDCRLPPPALYRVLDGKQAITTRVAQILGRYFNVDPLRFVIAQARHDITSNAETMRSTLDRVTPLIPKPAAPIDPLANSRSN